MEMRMTALCQVMPVDCVEAVSRMWFRQMRYRQVRYRQVRYRQARSLFGLLLTPVAAVAGTLAAWRFGVDVGWTGTFFVAAGFLSHWQVWSAFAVGVEICACSLRRRAGARVRAVS
jgi:hypothetical protein